MGRMRLVKGVAGPARVRGGQNGWRRRARGRLTAVLCDWSSDLVFALAGVAVAMLCAWPLAQGALAVENSHASDAGAFNQVHGLGAAASPTPAASRTAAPIANPFVGHAARFSTTRHLTTTPVGGPGARSGMVRIPGDTPRGLPADALRASATSAKAASKPLTITVVLKRTDQTGFDRYRQQVYDPHSSQHGQFLTQAQLANRFGPSLAVYDQTESWLRSQGMHVTQGSANRLSLTVRGNRAHAERAFHTQIVSYRKGGRSVYANTQDPALPSSIASHVQWVGLSDLAQPAAPRSNKAQLDKIAPCLVELLGVFLPNVEPNLAYLGVFALTLIFPELLVFAGLLSLGVTALGAAYNLGNLAQWANCLRTYAAGTGGGGPSVGKGSGSRRIAHAPSASHRVAPAVTSQVAKPAEKLGLLEFDTFRQSDVADWVNLTKSNTAALQTLSKVPVNGGVAAPGTGESEVLLDIATVLDLASNDSPPHVVVYAAPPSTSFVQMFQAMVADGDTVISNSWTQCEDQTSSAEAHAIDSVLAGAAASGISVFNGSGDAGSSCLDGSPNTVGVPADSPNATAVGGTTPKFGPGLNVVSQTWWNGTNETPPTGQGGFGVSRDFARPGFQAGLTGAPGRSVPDVAVDANPGDGIELCQADAGGCPSGFTYGGTSMAAPELAIETAQLDQALGHNVGNFNAAIYPIAAHPNTFTTPAQMGSDFAHVGLGAPNLQSIYEALKGLSPGTASPSRSSVVALPAPADGSTHGLVRVQLLDANGLPVLRKTVTVASASSTVHFTSDTQVTDSQGVAAFTATDTVEESSTITATDSTESVTLSTRPTLTFTTPMATGAELYGGPTSVPNDGTSKATITVYLQNALGRPAAGKTVSISQGGGHAVITPTGSSTPGTTAVTDSAGNAVFDATDTSQEGVVFTATDVSDGNLPVPGGVAVSFGPSTATCKSAISTPSAGFSASAFVTGLAFTTQTVVLPGNVTVPACSGQSPPAFDSAGNAFVPDPVLGTIHELGAQGGVASAANALPQAAFKGDGLGTLAFGKDGSLYAGLTTPGGNIRNPEIVQVDPVTGKILRVVANSSSGLPDCPFVLAVDPLSGDLFTDDECFGYAASNQITRIENPAGANPTVVAYTTDSGTNLGLAFAPDGTLYVAEANASCTIDAIGATNTTSRTPTSVASVPCGASGIPSAVTVGASGAGGHATTLDVFSFGGDVSRVDLTQHPAVVSTVGSGSSFFYIAATSAGGCDFAPLPGTIERFGSGSCGTAGTSPTQHVELSSSGPTPAPTGSSVTFTAQLSHFSSPSGTPVSFDVIGANTQVKLVHADPSGKATFALQGVLTGGDKVTASAADSSKGVTSAPLSQRWTAGKDVTFLDLNASQQGGAVGQPATITSKLVDVSQTPPTTIAGQPLTLGLGGQTCNAVTNGSGVASCQLTPGSVGLLNLTASYAGSSAYTPASSTNDFDATLAPGRATSTSVSCTPSSPAVGTAAACKATVTDTGLGAATTPTGTVGFSSDSSGAFSGPGSSCTLSGSGASASCTVDYTPSAVGSGTHKITAAYGGAATHAASSGSAQLTVAAGGGGGGGSTATATSLESSTNPAITGEQVTYTATVTPVPGGGTVAFTDSGAAVPGCSAVDVNTSTGTASCQASYGSPGSHPIVAAYSGNGSFAGSQSPTLTEVVSAPGGSAPKGTSTRLGSSAASAVTGQQVSYTATVSPAPDGGSVTFLDHGKPIAGCRAVALSASSGTAGCQTVYARPGSRLIQVAYAGDGGFTSSQSPTLTEAVMWSLTVQGSPSGRNGAVKLTLSCAPRSGGCRVTAALTSVTTRRSKISAHAKRHRPRTVALGAKTITIAAGNTTTVSVGLSRSGRRLLARFHRLPARMTVSLTVNGQRGTVAIRQVTVKPHRKSLRRRR